MGKEKIKIKWVNNGKDIPLKAREKANVYKLSDLAGLCDFDTSTLYLVRGLAGKWVEHHEMYHYTKRHPTKPRNPKHFALHELEANMYAYKKTGQPAHILMHLKGVWQDLAFNTYKLGERKAKVLIGQALREVKAPQSWMEDYKKLLQW